MQISFLHFFIQSFVTIHCRGSHGGPQTISPMTSQHGHSPTVDSIGLKAPLYSIWTYNPRYRRSLQVLLSEQETPAALRPPPFRQLRWAPWCRHWDRDISVPEQRTPLIATASALTCPGQYHVSCWREKEPQFMADISSTSGIIPVCKHCRELFQVMRLLTARLEEDL